MSKIKSWAECFDFEIGTYSTDQYGIDANLTQNISPLTKFTLNTFVNLIDKKNLLINFPSFSLRPIPLLAYTYVKLFNKSVLVFTSDNKKSSPENVNRNYQLFNKNGEGYLFYDIPMAYIKKDVLDYSLDMPRCRDPSLKSTIKDNLKSNRNPKIILNYDNKITKILHTIENISIDDENISPENDFDKNIDLGLIIFENVDRYINTPYNAKTFIEWIKKNIKSDMKILLHFNNLNYPFIEDLKKELGLFILDLNQSVLNNNFEIYNSSIEYFNNKPLGFKLINKYNIDQEYFYKNNLNIKIISEGIDSKGIDNYYFKTLDDLNYIKEEKIKNKCYYSISKNILYHINNLAINPAHYKVFDPCESTFLYYNIPYFLNKLRNNMNKENEENQYYLDDYISDFYNLYYRLSKCKRFGDNVSFEKIGKEYKLLEIISKKDELFGEDTNLRIGTYTNTEPSVLKKLIKRNGISNDKIEIAYINNFSKYNNEISNTILILPGASPKNYIPELLKPYKKIIILAYKNKNLTMTEEEIELLKNPTSSDEENAMNYFSEIYDYLKLKKNDKFFNDFKERSKKVKNTLKSNNNKVNSSVHETINFDDLIHIELPNYVEYVNNIENSEKEIIKISEKNIENINVEGIKFELTNLETDSVTVKSLPITKTFFSFKNFDEIDKGEELSPNALKTNDYVIIIDNNVNKTLLELVIDINGENINLSQNYLEYWKEELLKYIKNNNLTYSKFFKEYQNIGGEKSYQAVTKWAKGQTIGPRSNIDLLYIGKLINNEYIIENYQDIIHDIETIRKIHQSTGRRLKSMIKSILIEEQSLNLNNLSLEEEMIYKNIKNGIYQINKKI